MTGDFRVDRRSIESKVDCLDIRGVLDASTGDQLRKAATKTIDAGAWNLALNLSEVSFIDSNGLNAIAFIHAKVRKAGGQLMVVVGPQQRQIFSMIRLKLPIYEDEAQLLRSLT